VTPKYASMRIKHMAVVLTCLLVEPAACRVEVVATRVMAARLIATTVPTS
jgi:hypothetical protein